MVQSIQYCRHNSWYHIRLNTQLALTEGIIHHLHYTTSILFQLWGYQASKPIWYSIVSYIKHKNTSSKSYKSCIASIFSVSVIIIYGDPKIFHLEWILVATRSSWNTDERNLLINNQYLVLQFQMQLKNVMKI